MSPDAVEWIAVDWGTTNLRVWAMGADGPPLATHAAAAGMAALARNEFEPTLLSAIEPWLAAGRQLAVVACGMVGARQGWVEVPYAHVPSPPLEARSFRPAPCTDPRIAVTIVQGLCQYDPADVMRGEETQIAGLLALEPGYQGLACLPGTHSKWVSVAGGNVMHFRTFMTGEVFNLLERHSVLRHTLDGTSDVEEQAFDDGVSQAMSDPAGLASHLFSVRASGLLHGTPPAAARARLSGLLIGVEVNAMREAWSSGEVVLVGQGGLSGLYARALELAGGRSRSVDAEACTLAGLTAAWHHTVASRL